MGHRIRSLLLLFFILFFTLKIKNNNNKTEPARAFCPFHRRDADAKKGRDTHA